MKNTSKILTGLITFAMLASSICVTSFAGEAVDGSYGVNTTYLALKPGETGYITVSADNAAGRVDWSASGTVSVDGDTSAWLDNGATTIPVTAGSEGTGYITVSPTSIASYDGTELSSSYTIQVDVIGDTSSADNSQTAADTSQTTTDNSQAAADNSSVPAATPVAQVAAEDTANVEEQPAAEDAAAVEETQAEEETTVAENTTVLTDGSTDYAELSEEDRLYTTVNETELYMIRYPRMLNDNGDVVWNDEIAGLELLEGFELTRVNYKGLDVDAFTHGDTTVFVLKNLETDESDYYVLNDGVGFSKLTYVTANNKVYIVIDFPADFQVPDGYQMVELSLGDNKIHALKKLNTEAAAVEETQAAETEAAVEETTAAEETAPVEEAATAEEAVETEANEASAVVDSRTEVMLKGYEELISPGLDSADPSADIYYIYCLVDGQTQLYSYDSSEGTLQRASITVYDEIPTEPETVIVYENESENQNQLLAGIGWYDMAIQVKMLLIALAVAIIIIIVLIILYIVANCRNKKLSRAAERGMHQHARGNFSQSRRGNRRADNGDESIFSYVKTEPDDINMDDFDNM